MTNVPTEAPSHSEVTVGCRELAVQDPVQGVRIPAWLLYPARAPERLVQFGPYPLALATDAPIVAASDAPGVAPSVARLPLVLLSHGRTGSPWVYRGLAAHLAREGFAVALLEHPGDSRSDGSLVGTAANLENRPRHARLVLDALAASPELADRVAVTGVGVIGHSIGGYTALAMVGGRPTCLPTEATDGQGHLVSVVPDPRVSSLVLLAPAAGWFMLAGALAEVEVAILMLTGERDQLTPGFHAETIRRGLKNPERLAHRVVPGAGHFSFQSPFPPAMVKPEFPPSQDPEGFDRAAFQPVLYAEIATFLRAAR